MGWLIILLLAALVLLALWRFGRLDRNGVQFAASALLAIGFGMANPSLASLVSRRAGAGDQGMVLGVYQSAGSLARVVGPALAGVAFAQIDKSAPFLLGAAILVPVAIGVWRMVRR